jgi:MFS family permease
LYVPGVEATVVDLLGSMFGDDAEILHERDLQALLLANVLSPLGSGVVSPILDSLIRPFGTSASDVGLMISVFTAPAIVTIPLVGVLSDRRGRKPVLVVALLLFGVSGAAIAFTTEFRVVLALRLVQGVAFGGIAPVIITSIGDIFDDTEEATAQGLRFTGSGLSQTVFPLLSGALVVVAWRYPFLLYAMAVPIAAAVYRWFEEPTGAAAAATDGGDPAANPRALIGLVRRPRVLAMVVARGLPLFVWIGFITYNSIVVVRLLDGTPAGAGLLVAVGGLASAAAASQAGRLTALVDSRLYPLVGANVCLGAGFVGFVFAPTLAVAGVWIAVVGVGFGVALSLYRSIITGLAGESLRGGLVSVAEAVSRVVATATPVLVGAVIAAATPQVDLATAVRAAGVGAAVLTTGGGVVCLLVANAAPPVRPDT